MIIFSIKSLLNFAVASLGLRPNETSHARAVYLRLWILPLLVSTPITEYNEHRKYSRVSVIPSRRPFWYLRSSFIPALVLLSTLVGLTQGFRSRIEAERGPTIKWVSQKKLFPKTKRGRHHTLVWPSGANITQIQKLFLYGQVYLGPTSWWKIWGLTFVAFQSPCSS